ncbi:MAG: arginine decarboxylase [Flavobacteriales bacterium]|nr:arginine decarboxylase [Flavobacteriales bacterium]
MENNYYNLIDQTFVFPQDGFEVKDNQLYFRGIDLMAIVKQYGTPLKLTYLPVISERIKHAKRFFSKAMKKVDYKGDYTYCYCTKSSHFSFVLNEALKNDIHLETSSSFDIHIVRNLYGQGKIDKDTYIIHNGYKRQLYVELIAGLINDGFNSLPVLDNMVELEHFRPLVKKKCNIGIRIATGEEPQSNYYTARLGIRHREIVDYYTNVIKKEKLFKLKMLHFFIDNGIEDSLYYWNELQKCLAVYCELRKKCPTLDSLNIGGGFPVKHSLAEEFDYQYLADEIVRQVKEFCKEQGVPEPNIFSEFGSYTVADSGAAIYSIIDQKRQNDVEWWNMIDSSFITTLPDTWAINQRFIMLAVNRWGSPFERVNLGGLTCDSQDYYNVEAHVNNIYLPEYRKEEPLVIGFFNTGAYQNALGGYGGIQHCLIPSPRQIVVDKDKDGNITSELFCEEQGHEGMLKTLGYL